MKIKGTKVAIHQPDFISYLGFFNKINKSDIYVILDEVNISKSGWTHRDQIKSVNGPIWLTIPIKKIKAEKKINQIEIDNEKDWKKKHLNLIYENYKNAKFFNEVFFIVKKIYSYNSKKLIDFNYNTIKLLFKNLNINKKIFFLSELNVKGEKRMASAKYLNS